MIALYVRRPDVRSLDATPGHPLEPGDGKPRQRDHNLITRENIQLLPALQGPYTDTPDRAPLQLHRMQMQKRSDSPGATDTKLHSAYLSQCLTRRMFPGHCPRRRLGKPIIACWARGLAQNHPIGGEWQWAFKPARTPLLDTSQVSHRMRETNRIGKTQRH